MVILSVLSGWFSKKGEKYGTKGERKVKVLPRQTMRRTTADGNKCNKVWEKRR